MPEGLGGGWWGMFTAKWPGIYGSTLASCGVRMRRRKKKVKPWSKSGLLKRWEVTVLSGQGEIIVLLKATSKGQSCHLRTVSNPWRKPKEEVAHEGLHLFLQMLDQTVCSPPTEELCTPHVSLSSHGHPFMWSTFASLLWFQLLGCKHFLSLAWTNIWFGCCNVFLTHPSKVSSLACSWHCENKA